MTTQIKKNNFGTLIIMTVATLIFFPLIILWTAGKWNWMEGWLFAIWFDAMVLSNMIYLYFKDPALLAERSKKPGSDNQKSWDKYLLIGAYVMFMLWFILMPLDAIRFGWSPEFPIWLKILGGLLLLPSLYFIYQATAQNTYLSTMVRIQEERKQKVISTGVYGFVRHPLYLGCVLMLAGAPLLLGSFIGLGISLIALAVLIYRIIGEEKMLLSELDGYEKYKIKVRYRLVPFVW